MCGYYLWAVCCISFHTSNLVKYLICLANTWVFWQMKKKIFLAVFFFYVWFLVSLGHIRCSTVMSPAVWLWQVCVCVCEGCVDSFLSLSCPRVDLQRSVHHALGLRKQQLPQQCWCVNTKIQTEAPDQYQVKLKLVCALCHRLSC